MSTEIYTVLAIFVTISFGWWWSWVRQISTSNQHQPKVYVERTFRVRGVPNDWDRGKLETFLAERGYSAGTVIRSMAKEFHWHSQTATICFQNTSRLPQTLPLPVSPSSGPQSLKLDHDFHGITSLFAPSRPEHKVDIIAISGLGGHAFGSFKERHGEHMWLRDALPFGITGESGKRIARVMIYGYESSVPSTYSFQNLEDIGTTFHSSLRTLAIDGAFKPMVFIAHSLGGLVVKQILISLSKSNDEMDQKLRRAVYGIAFFGVPHDGMDIRSLIPMAGDGLNRFLLESIGSNSSQVLSNLNREFPDALGGRGESEIMSFYETCASPTAFMDKNGRWSMTGNPAILVSKSSATHCRPWENKLENICAINSTHSEMVKFKEDDSHYYMVLERINSLVRRAISPGKNPFLSEQVKDCLKSLAFEQMSNRGNEIERAIEGTCEWLFMHEAYKSWAASTQGLLWIKGKPGAGKSTLLKYAFNKQRDLPGASDGDLVLSFFFHGRGDALQKTPLGFLRSILHQGLKQAPEALSDLVDAYEQKCKDNLPGKWQWHPNELWRFLESSVPKILADRSIWLFVDALDECGEVNAKSLVQNFKSMLDRFAPLSTWIHFRICFSCRHYPILSFPGLLEVCVEMENKSDISTYVQSELELSSFEEPTPSVIQNLIIFRASGVFLWARLVVKQVQDLELDGAGPNKIEATIRSIPEGLHELYKELIQGMGPASLRLIRWICFATRPLSTEELRWAMVIDAKFPSIQACREADDYIPDSKRMNQQVIKVSQGLAEVTPGPGTQLVQFIHQSVKDFFMDRGLVVLDGSSISADEAIGMAHFQLSRICIQYLTMKEISQSASYERDKLKVEFPFLHYATTSWVSHLEQRDALGVPQQDILELFSWPSNVIIDVWTHVFRNLDQFAPYCPPAGTSLIHIAATYCILGTLVAIIESDDQTSINIDSKDEHGRTPLSLAAKNGHEAVVELLVNTGQVEVNSKDKNGRTPLSWAAENGNEVMVKFLLNIGAEIDLKDENNRTPLFWAVVHNHEVVVELLLSTGDIEVDSKDEDGRTPLLVAAGNGNEAVVKLLLNTGQIEVDCKDIYDRTPLSCAAGDGNEAVVKLLLDIGAEADLNGEYGRTPLWWASACGKEAAVELLLNTGQVEIDFKEDRNGQTPLLVAATTGYESVVKLLLNVGAEVNYKDKKGRTPLSKAAECGNEAMVKLLLDRGAEVDLGDNCCQTPLLFAAEQGHEAIVKLLLDIGATIDLGDNGHTPLFWAAEKGHEGVVRLLEAYTPSHSQPLS